MLYSICIALILVASVLIILAVLVQSPKSGMAANFGAANQVMGVRESSNFLEKFTWTMAVAILVLSLMATIAMDGNTTAKLTDDIEAVVTEQAEAPVVPQAEAAPVTEAAEPVVEAATETPAEE